MKENNSINNVLYDTWYILSKPKELSLVIWLLTVSQCELRWFHILSKISEDAELLWRLARASRDIAQLSRTSEEEKKVLVYEALEYAKRALEKNESSFAAHKVS